VDSVLFGRKEALSFFCTSARRPAKLPSGPPTNSHSSTTARGSAQRRDLRSPVELDMRVPSVGDRTLDERTPGSAILPHPFGASRTGSAYGVRSAAWLT
jgi:hypothetical protein